MFGKYRKFIIIALVFAASFLIYAMFFKGDQSDELLTSSTAQNPAAIVGSEIINALNQIESLRLSRDIFENPVYQSLKDRSQEITPEPVGKVNPFDPIQATAAPAEEPVQAPGIRETPPRPNTILNTTGQTQPVI